MAHTFTLTIKNPEKRLAEGKAAAEKVGVRLEGDVTGGTISGQSPLGSVKATYRALGNDLYQIEVLEKPFLVPMSMVEQKVREAIG
ncbi:MAG: hypothetical protein V1913_17590 [Fibrobacterota bacterium]